MTTFDIKTRWVAGGRTQPVAQAVDRLDRRSLARLVIETVRELEGQELRRVAPEDAGAAFRPPVMLALLTYSYALGVYGAEDIERMMIEDSALCALCGREVPSGRLLRHFRRENRAALQRTLTETLRQARHRMSRRGDGMASPAPVPGGAEPGADLDRTQTWHNDVFAMEARNRIERAMFIDRMEWES
jgi:transposase